MELEKIGSAEIESKIYVVRGFRIILDHDLAVLYQVSTTRLNEQVRRNSGRFPPDFMFSLTKQELTILLSQFAIARLAWGGRRNLPNAFTEQGIAMLSSVLKSERAISVNIAIMRAFVQMRSVLNSHRDLEKKFTTLERKYDGQFRVVFDAIKELMSNHPVPRKRIIGFGSEEK